MARKQRADSWWRRWLDARERERYARQRRAAYDRHLRSDYWKALRERALLRAGYRCEWVLERGARQGLRCSETRHLEAHHLHYHTFGHETLADIQVLCPEHHAIADRRRVARSSR